MDASLGAGVHASLATDGSGKLHLAFVSSNLPALVYATRPPGAEWFVSPIDWSAAAGPCVSVAVSPDGGVYVGAYHFWAVSMWFASHPLGSEIDDPWLLMPVAGEVSCPFVLLAADAAGGLHAAYRGVADGPIVLSERSGWSEWTPTAVLESTGCAVTRGAIAGAEPGRVHLAYWVFTGSCGPGPPGAAELRHVDLWTGGTAAPSTVASVGAIDAGEAASLSVALALDADGLPNLVYRNPLDGELHVAARRADGGFAIESVDVSGEAGPHADVAVDRDANVHVAYGASGDAFRHACRPPGGAWAIEAVDDGTGDGDETQIVVDPSGCVHVTWRSTEAGVRHAWRCE